MKTILLSVLLAGLALAAPEVKAVNTAPAGVDLVNFPIVKDGGLTVEKTADLKLVPARLEESVVVMNHYRFDNSWRVQTLQKGDLVYKDQTGEIRYRAFCSNRVVVVKNCPAPPTVLQAVPAPQKELGWLDNMVEKFTNAWKASTGAVGTAWGTLLPMLGFLALPLIAGGYWLYRRLRPVPPPPAQPAQPDPPVVPARPPIVHPSPTGLGRNQRM